MTNVFVAARIDEGAPRARPGAVLGYWGAGISRPRVGVGADVVPVGLDEAGIADLAGRITRMRRQVRLGVRAERAGRRPVGPARSVMGAGPGDPQQPAPAGHFPTPPSALGVSLDPHVRLAGPDELDLVLPAAAHMFTEEIGYPPFFGSDRGYRASVSGLIRAGHTFVRSRTARWSSGRRRVARARVRPGAGRLGPSAAPRPGIAVPAMAGVVEQVLTGRPTTSRSSNDFNVPARATYARCGFHEIGAFTTVLL